MKVKYKWELIHGDADHRDEKKLLLTEKTDIAFFDYVISLEFESYDHEGFTFFDEENDYSDDITKSPQYQKLIELYKNTKFYKEKAKRWPEDKDDPEEILEWIYDSLSDWGYTKGDITCDGLHYAQINYVDRKEAIEKTEPKDSDLMKYALELLGITKEQLIEQYKNR